MRCTEYGARVSLRYLQCTPSALAGPMSAISVASRCRGKRPVREAFTERHNPRDGFASVGRDRGCPEGGVSGDTAEQILIDVNEALVDVVEFDLERLAEGKDDRRRARLRCDRLATEAQASAPPRHPLGDDAVPGFEGSAQVPVKLEPAQLEALIADANVLESEVHGSGSAVQVVPSIELTQQLDRGGRSVSRVGNQRGPVRGFSALCVIAGLRDVRLHSRDGDAAIDDVPGGVGDARLL